MFVALLATLAAAQDLSIDVNYAVPGQTTKITVGGARPGETVRVVRSFQGPGNGPCPAALGGMCIDVRSPVLLPSATADQNGEAVVSMNVPSTAPLGNAISFQALVARGQGGASSVKSDVVSETVGESHRTVVSVDGDASDFPPGSWFDTSSGMWAVTWDDTHLYVAAVHADVGASPEHWVILYFGDNAAQATTGVQHNTQTPGLNVPASRAVRWKADGSYSGYLEYDAATGAWSETPNYLGTMGSSVVWNTTTDEVEFAIPLSEVGPNVFTLQGAWVYEGNGFESTYAGLPYDAFTDGYDPDFATALWLDRRSSHAAAEQ